MTDVTVIDKIGYTVTGSVGTAFSRLRLRGLRTWHWDGRVHRWMRMKSQSDG